LKGEVLHEDGWPVSKATVFIYTAGPKQGTAMLCPSCYADCTKKAATDSAGRFTIESLDPKLVFRLLVVAAGHESTFISKVDPTNGVSKVTLKQRSAEALTAATRIAGVVMNEEGEPVAGAVISTQGVQVGELTHWGGTDPYADPVAVADTEGFFLLPCKPAVKQVHAMAEAPGVAKRWVTLTPGKDHIVRMVDGVTVTGRVLRDGKPLKDVVLGLTTVERQCGMFLHEFEAATDKDGRFIIANVTPANEYHYYAKMESLGSQGALRTSVVRSGPNGKTVDLGDLQTGPAHTLKGRVVLSDGQKIPADTRLFLGREKAWDHSEVSLDPEGRFEFAGLPAEPISLAVRVKGYKVSKRNPSLDWLNGGIVGTVDRDIQDFTILLEPGEWSPNREDQDRPPGIDSQPSQKPLQGAKL
jgi:hypothetical protein